MSLLCVRYPHLSLVAILRRHPELRAEPVVVGGRPELRLPVLAASPAAVAAGVRVGQPLRQAQQRCPAAVFVPCDEETVTRLRDHLLRALLAVAPTVEVGDTQAYVALEGGHARYRDDTAWAAAAARAVGAALDAAPAAGLAGSRFVAGMAARQAVPGRLRRVQGGDEAAFLATLPISVLPAAPRVLGRLAALGLDCLGALAALSPADLQRQFGGDGLRLHRLARGIDAEGLHAWEPPGTMAERLVLEGPVSGLEALRFAIRRCVDTLGERLLQQGLACAEVGVVLELEGAAPLVGRRVAATEAGSASELWPSVLGLLAELCIPAGVSSVAVEVGRLSAAGGRQVDLLRQGDASRDTVARTVARLHDRFGAGTVQQPELVVDPGDLPERRFRWVSTQAIAAAVGQAPPAAVRAGSGPLGAPRAGQGMAAARAKRPATSPRARSSRPAVLAGITPLPLGPAAEHAGPPA